MRQQRSAAVLASVLLLCHAASVTRAARGPGEVGIQGIPVCPVGFPACGMYGCYTPLLSKCDPSNGCISVKLLSQLSAFVRFGSSAAAHAGACPIGFANRCGDVFCAMGEVCSGGVCQASSSSSAAQQLNTLKVRDSPTAAKAACLAARYGSTACAGDLSDLSLIDCNLIGVASVKGIYCFQSQMFNCAVQAGGSATHTCRGMAGVAQAVGEVWNTTLNTAAKVAEEVADAISKTDAVAGSVHPSSIQAGVGVPLALSDPIISSSSSSTGGTTSGSSSSGSGGSAKEVLRAGANAALETLGHAYRDKGQPLLQPLFQGLASMVNNATYSLLNKTGEGIVEMGETAKVAIEKRFQPTFDLGKPPIKDAAGDVHVSRLVLLLVGGVSALLLL